MAHYSAPVSDMLFILHDVLALEDRDTSEAVLTEAARFAEQVLEPLRRSGDEEGARLVDGSVKMATGYNEAYRAFVHGGWPGLSCAEEHGGQGLGAPLQFAVTEMINAANISFALAPLLTASAYHAVSAHGSDALKARYLPKLVSGDWPGTMCLTEAHCGTDLGLLKTRAVPDGDAFRLSGTKIFITYGDHDMAENIVHLVLARLPDAPAGVKGISLFLCPKVLPDRTRNAVRCTALERKMGIHASPTCVMNFDDATAWLVGEPHKGLACMFTMMNDARLLVGIQGLGLADAATQAAANYARTRLQMRAVTGAKQPLQPADPIIVHPDVRRMILTNRAMVEGCRALALWVAVELDVSHHVNDVVLRQHAADRVALLTPVVKAMLSDLGTQAANDAVQVYGGHGFIRDSGVEQFVRDARITQIYEGTNGIQALDLVGRKLKLDGGQVLQRHLVLIAADIAECQTDESMAFATALSSALTDLHSALSWLQRNSNIAVEAAAAATPFARLFGLVVVGHMWLKQVSAVLRLPHKELRQRKLALASVFAAKLLPETRALRAIIEAGASSLMELPDEAV